MSTLYLFRGAAVAVRGRPGKVEEVHTYVEDGRWAVEVTVIFENGDWEVVEDPDLLSRVYTSKIP